MVSNLVSGQGGGGRPLHGLHGLDTHIEDVQPLLLEFSPDQIKQVLIVFNGTGIRLSMHQFSRFLIHCLDLLLSTWSNIGPTAELCFRKSAQKYFGHNSKEILQVLSPPIRS